MNAILGKILPFQVKPESKEAYFEEVRDFRKDRELIAEKAIKVGFWIGGIGTLVGVVGIACAASMFPLKTYDPEYFAFNQLTGYVGPTVKPQDAATLFTTSTIEAALQRLVELRESYQYETDPISFHAVTIMSSADEQQRFKAIHDAPDSPSRVLRERGSVMVNNFQFWLMGTGKEQTKQYVVKFDRFVMKSGESVPTKGEPCTANVSFQFHPEYVMSPPDRRTNPTGLWTISYSSHSDNPNKKSVN